MFGKRLAVPFAAVATLAVCFGARFSAAQGTVLSVERAGSGDVPAASGQPVSMAVRIHNASDSAHAVASFIDLPAGWRVVIPAPLVAVGGGGTETVLSSVAVPLTAEAGRYRLRYSVRAVDDSTAAAHVEIPVFVRTERRIDLEIEDEPEFVAAGQNYAAGFRVTNTGNTPTRVDLTATVAGDLTDRSELTSVQLDPGESEVVAVDAVTSVRGLGVITMDATVEADPTIRIRRTSRVAIHERGDVDGGLHEMPARVELRIPSSGLVPYPQVTVSASGNLFDAGTERLDLLIRAPSQRSVGFYGMTDMYRAAYRSERLDVLLGDHVYALSPLTAGGESLFGAQTDVRFGRTHVGGFVNRSRWTFFEQEQAAAYVRYGSEERYAASLNALTRTGINEGSLASVRGTARPHELLHVDAELAGGSGAQGASGERTGGARRLQISGSRSGLSYVAQHERVGEAYPSNSSGQDFNALRLNVRPLARWDVFGHYLLSSRTTSFVTTLGGDGGLDVDEESVAEARYRRSHARLGTRVRADLRGVGLRAGTTYIRAGQRSAFAGSVLEGISESVQGDVRVGYRSFDVLLAAEVGELTVDDSGTSNDFREYTLQTSFHASARYGFNAFARYYAGPRMFSPLRREHVTLTFNAYARLLPRTRVQLRTAVGISNVPIGRRDYLVEGEVEHTLGNGHFIGASILGQSLSGTAIDRILFLLTYRIPFDVPITRSRVDGSVEGYVVDAERAEGIPTVRVFLNDRVSLTDARGRFVFAGVRPDAYRLRMNRGDIGLDRVPSQDLPLDLTVEAGRSQTVRIDVARAASVSGTINLYAFAQEGELSDDTSLVSLGGFPGVQIELSRDGTRLSQATNSAGRFVFAGLRAGTWRLTVVPMSVPRRHDVRSDSIEIELSPGESVSVTMDVVPRQRVIRFIQRDDTGARQVEAAEGDAHIAQPEPRREESPSVYVVTRADIGLMDISRKVYGDASLWPKIWLANRDVLDDPDVIEPGMRLTIPPTAPLTPSEVAAKASYSAAR